MKNLEHQFNDIFNKAQQRKSPAQHKSSVDNKEEAERHFYLAECYYDGSDGYPVDVEAAFIEYLEAAKLGHTGAMTALSTDYMSSESVLGYDLENAEMWARKLIEYGDSDGHILLYRIYNEKDEGKKAMEQLEIGVSKGNLYCIEWKAYHLYYGYKSPDIVIEPDKEQAFELLTGVEWDDEHGLAFLLLGAIHENKGDYHKAIVFYEKALSIDPDDIEAMAQLGILLYCQEEVKDLERARILFAKASDGGHVWAMNFYGMMHYYGEGMQKDVAGAIKWLQRAAHEGNAYSMLELGDIFRDEQPDKARYWYEKAAAEGIEDALERLEEMDEADAPIDTSRSDKIYEYQLDKLDANLVLPPKNRYGASFQDCIDEIKKAIKKGDLSDYECDRLRLLAGWMSLVYFKYHFFDEDFYKNGKDEDLYAILDSVDDFVLDMSDFSDEAEYLYLISNMYSCHRFKDIDPVEKLESLWSQLSEIKLDYDVTEFKISYWNETAKDVHDTMCEILDAASKSNSSSYNRIKDKVIAIVADTLGLDEDDVYPSSLLADLGADSLDAVDLIMKMEKKFDLRISDANAQKIRTVEDIIRYVEAYH